MPTRERTLKERHAQVIQMLTTLYQFPTQDAEFIADKALERARDGQEFRTQVTLGMLSGELVVDISVMLCLSCTLKGDA